MHYKQVHHQKMKKENVRMFKKEDEVEVFRTAKDEGLKSILEYRNQNLPTNHIQHPIKPELKNTDIPSISQSINESMRDLVKIYLQ